MNAQKHSTEEEDKNFSLEIRSAYIKYQIMTKKATSSGYTGGCWSPKDLNLKPWLELSPH